MGKGEDGLGDLFGPQPHALLAPVARVPPAEELLAEDRVERLLLRPRLGLATGELARQRRDVPPVRPPNRSFSPGVSLRGKREGSHGPEDEQDPVLGGFAVRDLGEMVGRFALSLWSAAPVGSGWSVEVD